MALEPNLAVADRAMELGNKICSHGYRWIDYQGVPEDVEREHISKAADIFRVAQSSRLKQFLDTWRARNTNLPE